MTDQTKLKLKKVKLKQLLAYRYREVEFKRLAPEQIIVKEFQFKKKGIEVVLQTKWDYKLGLHDT